MSLHTAFLNREPHQHLSGPCPFLFAPSPSSQGLHLCPSGIQGKITACVLVSKRFVGFVK